MLNPNINYPYPLIREKAEDYRTTIFTGALAVNLQPDGYLIRPDFRIENDEIAELLLNGTLTYAIEVESPKTWYRKLFPVKNNNTIKLETATLHERVELTPCIIATIPISDFSNADFEEEYQGMTFSINVGDVVAIGEKRRFDALYQNDIIKNGSSIVNISGDDVKEIFCNFAGPLIEIVLPENQYKEYTECGYDRSKYKTLNAILTIPALVEAIGYIYNDEEYPDHTSGFESYAWYKTIVVNLKRVAENDDAKYHKLLEKPFATAELLLGNNYAHALKYVNQID